MMNKNVEAVRATLKAQRDRIDAALSVLNDPSMMKMLGLTSNPVLERHAQNAKLHRKIVAKGNGYHRTRKKCPCGKGFLTKNRKDQMYCSPKCSMRRVNQNRTMYSHTCLFKPCSKKFETSIKDSKFCSMSHRAKFYNNKD